MWTSSSSSCGLSLGPGDPLTGDPPPLPPVLLADDCLTGEDYLNGEAAPPLPPVLLADEALAGDLDAPPPPAPLLTNSANSV